MFRSDTISKYAFKTGCFVTLINDFAEKQNDIQLLQCLQKLDLQNVSQLLNRSVITLTKDRARSKLIIHNSNLVLFIEPTNLNQTDIFEESLYYEVFNEYLSKINQCVDYGMNYIDCQQETDENCFILSCGEANWDKYNTIGIKAANIFNQLLEPKEAIRIFGEDRYKRVFCEIEKLTKGEIRKTDKTIKYHGVLIGIFRNEKHPKGVLSIEDNNISFKFYNAKFGERLSKIHGDNLKCKFEFEVYKDLVGIKQTEILLLKKIINS
jgi:hypothetical protein